MRIPDLNLESNVETTLENRERLAGRSESPVFVVFENGVTVALPPAKTTCSDSRHLHHVYLGDPFGEKDRDIAFCARGGRLQTCLVPVVRFGSLCFPTPKCLI